MAISLSRLFCFSQSNVGRKPLEEMLAAEQGNKFTYATSNGEPEIASTDVLTNRLQDLDISKVIPSTTGKSSAPENAIKTTSSSRPLTIDDDDDVDLDLEIDDTIDTTVSRLIYACYVPLLFLIVFFTQHFFFVHADDIYKCF